MNEPPSLVARLYLEPKDLVFYTNNQERIRLCENGDFLVNGKKIAEDKELYYGLKTWFEENWR